MVRFKVGVAGCEEGGVGSIACSGIILYSPSLERKSCQVLVAHSLTRGIRMAHWYAAACTDSCTRNDNYLVRTGKDVGDLLELPVVCASNVLEDHDGGERVGASLRCMKQV